MSRRVYIAGPMTGYRDRNRPAFYKADAILRQFFPEDFIFNPAGNDKKLGIDKTATLAQREKVMRLDYSYLTTCDHVVLLEGWGRSEGCRSEVDIALRMGSKIGELNLMDNPGEAYVQWWEKPEVVGLAGYARSGKDSVANEMSQEGWRAKGFAEPIRAIAYAINPTISLTMEHFSNDGGTYVVTGGQAGLKYMIDAMGWEEMKKEGDVRRLLQRLGTEGCRKEIFDHVWLEKMRWEIMRGGKWVITDVRYPNEISAIHILGGVVAWVDRGLGPLNEHASENSITREDCDLVINNRGSREGLKTEVGRFLEHIKNHPGEARKREEPAEHSGVGGTDTKGHGAGPSTPNPGERQREADSEQARGENNSCPRCAQVYKRDKGDCKPGPC